jgi:exodeoxyribonuclease VII large subunit
MIEAEAPARILTVTELNRMARMAVERALPLTWIAGEVSNLTRAPSGHWYFTLKDASAAVRCAMFRNRNQFMDWRPENGMQVEVRAQATLYEPRGEFQLSVEAMRRAGLGALFEAFQRLKDKLGKEGLFDQARKRALPAQPDCVGVVTSPRAAALQDVLTTLRRRWPLARVVLYPTQVQGAGSAALIAQAINTAGERAECNVLLVVRGGGSIEDLWSFNEEAVARAIASCPVPVVSGVGHETDFTIADFVADVRAPTPTGAVQLATPDIGELLHRLGQSDRNLRANIGRRMDFLGQRLDGLGRRLQHPRSRLDNQSRHLTHLTQRLVLAKQSRLARLRLYVERLSDRAMAIAPNPGRELVRVTELQRRLGYLCQTALQRRLDQQNSFVAQLSHLNPQAVLERGYSIVWNKSGEILRSSAQACVGDDIAVTLAKGRLTARIFEHLP